MGRNDANISRGRPSGRAGRASDGGRDLHQRAHIAQIAARLIAENGITDWGMARRKAAHQLMLGNRAPMPGDDEIEDALVEYHALFGGKAHAAALAEMRAEALRWMQRLARFSPTLIGGVAAGWATVHSDIRLELVAADAKAVELVLLGEGLRYRTMPADRDGATELWVDTPKGGLRLSVRSAEAVRQRSLRDRHGRIPARLTEAALAALLGGAEPSSP